jgi:integrase
MSLTDTAVRQSKPKDKPYKLSDDGGMYLLVSKSGKYWRMDYRFSGKRKTLALGIYPDVPLAGENGARQKRDDARKLLARGVDPGAMKQAEKLAGKMAARNSFESVAREWIAVHNPATALPGSKTWAPSTVAKTTARLENDVFPWLGGRPIVEISASELLVVVKRIAGRGVLETAHRVLADCGQIFRYAVQHGIAERDPTPDLRGALPAYKGKNFAAIIDPVQTGELLRAIDGFKGTLSVQCALRLSPLVFVRPGELRQAEWAQIDLERAEWSYLATKTETDHIVPLSKQAVAILRELQPLTGAGRYVFPGARTADRPMSDAAVNAALRRMGYAKDEMTGHGFRAMARTLLAEKLRVDERFIERQLCHKVPGALGTAYDRAKFIDERRAMMQQWADYLDKLKAGADVIPLFKAAA